MHFPTPPPFLISGGDGEASLYEDDGASIAYETGDVGGGGGGGGGGGDGGGGDAMMMMMMMMMM